MPLIADPDMHIHSGIIERMRKVSEDSSLEDLINQAKNKGYCIDKITQVFNSGSNGGILLKGTDKELQGVITSYERDDNVIYELYERDFEREERERAIDRALDSIINNLDKNYFIDRTPPQDILKTKNMMNVSVINLYKYYPQTTSETPGWFAFFGRTLGGLWGVKYIKTRIEFIASLWVNDPEDRGSKHYETWIFDPHEGYEQDTSRILEIINTAISGTQIKLVNTKMNN